ncbi:MAG: hypothetical protein IKS18_03495 [Lachnospiraceae bacterium]|nr:hypothetical protein [Lachnospiraceae bacterium]
MKRLAGMVLSLIFCFGLILTSCKETKEPLLITDAGEMPTEDEREDESAAPESEGIIPADNYISTDYDPRCRNFVCESEKRIYYVSGAGYLDHFDGNSRKYIFFIDKESGAQGVLCGREGCQHNSTDCLACIGNDSVLRLALHDGKLLLAAARGSEHPEIHIYKGGTDGSGFREIGAIPAVSYEADTEGTWISEAFFHRGYFYILSEKSVAEEQENPYSAELPDYTGLIIRAIRFPLDNLNISEELYCETMKDEWISSFPWLIPDRDDLYLGIRLAREDPENWRNTLSGALRMYRLTDVEAPELLYEGEIPVMGGVTVRDGAFRLTGRTYDNKKMLVYRFDPETKRFIEEMKVGTLTEDADELFSSFGYNGEYFLAIQDGVNLAGLDETQLDADWSITFYGENGKMLSEHVLNVGKTMEKLQLSPSEFGEAWMFYVNFFAADRDAYYAILNISSWGGAQKQYQALVRIPVEEGEDWSLFLEGGDGMS